jgi:hypothetical protein
MVLIEVMTCGYPITTTLQTVNGPQVRERLRLRYRATVTTDVPSARVHEVRH